jgi:hypothetical protein
MGLLDIPARAVWPSCKFLTVDSGPGRGLVTQVRSVSRVAINALFPTSPATVLARGIPAAPVWPNFNPGEYPFLAVARITCLFSIGPPGDRQAVDTEHRRSATRAMAKNCSSRFLMKLTGHFVSDHDRKGTRLISRQASGRTLRRNQYVRGRQADGVI